MPSVPVGKENAPADAWAGYGSPGYAASLAEFGEPQPLRRSGGWIIVRSIPQTPHRDATGPYPLFACSNWSGLIGDIEDLPGDLVSLAIVTDPFGAWTPAMLRQAFPDRAAPFKKHFVVDLRRPTVATHHRRNATRAHRALDVELVADPAAWLDDWVALYDNLVRRHSIEGNAAFSRAAFAAQLAVPGLTAMRAMYGGKLVGGLLWYVVGSVVYYHLGAYTEKGYELGASFALFSYALEHFAAGGLDWLSLGAGAGVRGDASDGLSRFKRGWSTGTRTAYFCGRVLCPERYSELVAKRRGTSFFPPYRAPAPR